MKGARCRIVLRIDQDKIIEFESATAACESVNGYRSDMYKAIRKSKIYKGFIWKYKEFLIENEIWVKHPNLDLECSDQGRVRNINSKRVWTPSRKYRNLEYLAIGYKLKRLPVHRLIAQTFIENPENKPTVDHIDRNPANNKLDNLRWATYKEQNNNKNNNKNNNLPIIPNLD